MVAFLQVSSSPKVNPSSNLLLLLVICAGLLLLVQQRNWGTNWKLLVVQRNWGGNERNLNNERRTWIRPHNYIWTEVQGQTGKGKHDDEPVCDKKVRRAYEQLPVRNVTYGRWLGKDCVGLFFFNIHILRMHFWGVGRENIRKMGQEWSLFMHLVDGLGLGLGLESVLTFEVWNLLKDLRHQGWPSREVTSERSR